ncbi:DHH family phosphoesterase [Gracilinema caldarium]|uniref:Phosphoesterase RecJ domain protein n=1 Tax=Gracilinema caldarium (strain ATCC 51460 / DSM 7334 / H1) TaxID=744872 RepID=F8EY34_GRAC1|nr:DHHA1 domain-containing protein [Gracilinema caldarium]AEJ20695.1 phosphoesterase RecJ domain protein [Gracilinema caldarium DSM 7334]
MGSSSAFEQFNYILATLQIKQADDTILVQPHDFPDHDAVASAFGLGQLLERLGLTVRLVHRGPIRSHSLKAMIRDLQIPLQRIDEILPTDIVNQPCIIVDGSPNNANAHPLTMNVIAVIDHHVNPGALDVPFVDIRTSYGACSSIITDYWQEAELIPDRRTATALLMGIQIDTDFLSRRVSPADLNAHHRLFFQADWQFGTQVVKASLSIQDLKAFHYASDHYFTSGNLFFTMLPTDCTQELISILADFFLRLREILVTVIVEAGGDRYHVSVRSRAPDISAASVVRLALAGIGEGGGHDHMAGGIINTSVHIDEQALFRRFVKAMETAQENQ